MDTPAWKQKIWILRCWKCNEEEEKLAVYIDRPKPCAKCQGQRFISVIKELPTIFDLKGIAAQTGETDGA